MANHELENWPVETIPDPDRLFYRVHRNLVPDGKLGPNVFREQKGSMSTDWEKYSTPAETLSRAADPTQNGLVALVAGEVRRIEDLEVRHAPLTRNRAHAEIHGILGSDTAKQAERKTRLRVKLFKICNKWLIDPFQANPSSELKR